MPGWKTVVIVIVAAVLGALGLASWRTPGARPAGADDFRVSQRIRDEVANSGRARVIVEVELPVPFVAEGDLPGRVHVGIQRANLAQAQSRVLSRLQGRGHTLVHQFETVPYLVLEVEADALAELEASGSEVRRVLEDRLYDPLLPQSVPLVEGPLAWAAGFDGTGVTVAILDTGVDKTHPFLAGKVVEEACYSTTSFAQSTSFCPNGQAEQLGPGAGVNCVIGGPGDICWHGTHVAGIAAGNGAGAGVPFSGVAKGAQIMAVQVFSKGTSVQACGAAPPCLKTYASDLIRGLERVYTVRDQHTFAAVNVSIGGSLNGTPCDDNPAKPAIDNLRSVGIATVFASGNNGFVSATSEPACVSTAVSVGNTGKDDVVWPSSNVATFLTLFAPGGTIMSSVPGGGWMTASGTSMAAPHVTGAFAVLKQAAPGASVTALLTALQQTGLPITDTRLGGSVTKPRIRIAQALATLAPPVPHTLSVSSTNPSSGVAVTVSPLDTSGHGSGTTAFNRVYASGALVSLTAPLTAQSKTFQKWQRDGTDVSTSTTVQVTMDADHALTAVYVASTFADVLPSHPFWSWIEKLFAAGITTGCGANPPVYCPDQGVSRGQMAVFLLRGLHGAAYKPPAATGVFADVPASDLFAPWIEQLFADGIVTGCGSNPLRYCPGQDVTRAQMAILLLKSMHGAGYHPPAATGIFADVPAADPSAPWIEQFFAEGLTSGCATNPLRYCPGQSLTRAEMATFLVRAFSL